MNIVSLIMQFLTPALLGKMASSTGLGGAIVQKAVGALVPSILSGLMGSVAKPGGAAQLAGALGKMDSGMLGNLANMIGGSGQNDLVNNGSNMLSSLLGGSASSGLAGAVSKFAGIGDGPAKMLMGMVAPAVMGSLAQQQKSQGLDAGGLASMLLGQKDNISAAMPAGFSNLLSGTGLLDGMSASSAAGSIGGAASAAAGAAGRMASSASSAAQGAAHNVGSAVHGAADAIRPSRPAWMWPALAALAALLGWWWFSARTPQIAALPVAPKIMAGTTDVGAQLGTLFGDLRGSLGSVTDAASATTALPKLRASAEALGKLQSSAGSMAPDARKALAGYVTTAGPAINPMLATVLNLPGVGAILKPIIEQIMTAMTALGKA